MDHAGEVAIIFPTIIYSIMLVDVHVYVYNKQTRSALDCGQELVNQMQHLVLSFCHHTGFENWWR